MFREEILKETAAAAFLDLAEKAASAASPWAREEVLAAGYEAVFRAMLAYRPEKGYFGAFAARCVKNATSDEARRWQKDYVPLEDVGWQEAKQLETDAGGLAFLEGKERVLAEMLLAGYSKGECAQRLGISNRMVSYLCRKVAKKLTKGSC